MASTARLGLVLVVVVSIILSILSSSATARPCKTLLISSYSFSVKPLHNKNNPNNPSSGFVAIVTRTTTQHVRGSSEIFLGRGRFFPVPIGDDVGSFDDDRRQREEKRAASSILPLWVSSSSSSSSSPAVAFYDMSSIRDRARDILSVVVALLFGVGCGALTAATMYLIWSLFATTAGYSYYPYLDDEESSGSEGEEEDDVKKLGYVKIPEAVKADSVAKPLKEAAAV